MKNIYLAGCGGMLGEAFYSIMKDDIVNFRPLTGEQITQLETLTEIQKIELIKLYNKMNLFVITIKDSFHIKII